MPSTNWGHWRPRKLEAVRDVAAALASLRDVLDTVAQRGAVAVFTQPYKRYRVSTPRMSHRPRTMEILVAVDLSRSPSEAMVDYLVERIEREAAGVESGD
ncbi:MAG: hypothetical protein ACRDFX_10930 [Chloroflexota bacterium]